MSEVGYPAYHTISDDMGEGVGSENVTQISVRVRSNLQIIETRILNSRFFRINLGGTRAGV